MRIGRYPIEKDFVEQLKGRVKRISKEALRERIIAFLQQEVICSLATCSSDMPRAKPCAAAARSHRACHERKRLQE
jgi:hypothetical protein